MKIEVRKPTAEELQSLVVFPQGLSCVWKVSQPVRKHYRFG